MTMVQSVLLEDGVEPGRSKPKLTYTDYLRLPDDDLRHEIIEGEHYVTASPNIRHQRISRRLLYLIEGYLQAHPIGEVFDAPTDVVLSDINVVVPDLIYVSNERAHTLTSQNVRGAPDLIVEILSPGTRRRDEGLKREVYEQLDVREYWLVDPEANTIVVYRRSQERFHPHARYTKAAADILTTDLLPGLDVPLEVILA
jgi:Uma2 family endonuclease